MQTVLFIDTTSLSAQYQVLCLSATGAGKGPLCSVQYRFNKVTFKNHPSRIRIFSPSRKRSHPSLSLVHRRSTILNKHSAEQLTAIGDRHVRRKSPRSEHTTVEPLYSRHISRSSLCPLYEGSLLSRVSCLHFLINLNFNTSMQQLQLSQHKCLWCKNGYNTVFSDSC